MYMISIQYLLKFTNILISDICVIKCIIYMRYMSDFPYFYYIYQVPDMNSIITNHIYISYISNIYQVSNIYLIELFLTSDYNNKSLCFRINI